MINKYSSPSNFSDNIASQMDQALKTKFSFIELTSILVKCAEELEEANDKLSSEVDGVLGFIETEIIN